MRRAGLLLVLLLASAAACAQTTAVPLKVLTINVWSGLDYHGTLSYGEYETEGMREVRYRRLCEQIRRLDPAVLFLQEANPISRYASRMAEELGCDEIHQVVNGGMKIGCAGIPSNLKEGMAILARKGLHLKRFAARKLSGYAGLHGDAITFHVNEVSFALAGRIRVDGIPLILVNTHLTAAPERDSLAAAQYLALGRSGAVSEQEYRRTLLEWEKGIERRAGEIRALAGLIGEFPPDIPVILGGDFNCSSGAAELKPIRESGFVEALSLAEGETAFPTWDPVRNPNISFSTADTDASGNRRSGMELLSSLFDARPRRIDHIFLGSSFRESDVASAGLAVDSTVDGVQASDHFGWYAAVRLNERIRSQAGENDSLPAVRGASFQLFPILSYDTDAGLGYGATAILVNPFGFRESFDLLGFNTSRGERWYRFIFSLPDRELRQGRIYPFALDLTADYDKWISYRFYGTGNRSRYSDEEIYSREPLILSLAFSRGFTPTAVGQAGFRYRAIRNTNFSADSRLARILPAANAGTIRCPSIFASYRYDSRDSFINPSGGEVLQAEAEYARLPAEDGGAHLRLAGWYQHYAVLFYPTTIFALRAGLQSLVGGSALPIQVLLPIGGNQTLRGSVQDRYLDKVSALINAEIRFPLIWKFGGVLGLDAGKVWSGMGKLDFSRWAWNPVAGIRFYWDRIIVRADLGFGRETTGFYLNFGQLF